MKLSPVELVKLSNKRKQTTRVWTTSTCPSRTPPCTFCDHVNIHCQIQALTTHCVWNPFPVQMDTSGNPRRERESCGPETLLSPRTSFAAHLSRSVLGCRNQRWSNNTVWEPASVFEPSLFSRALVSSHTHTQLHSLPVSQRMALHR